MTERPKTAAEFDARFDAGEDMGEWVDWHRAHRPNQQVAINVPNAVAQRLDLAADREGVSREALLVKLLDESLPKAA